MHTLIYEAVCLFSDKLLQNTKIPVVVRNNVQLCRDTDIGTQASLYRAQQVSKLKSEVCKNKIWQAKIRKQSCSNCQKQPSTFAVKECDAAVPAGHMLHVPPKKCERAQSHVSSSQFPASVSRETGLYVPNVLTELLSPHFCACSEWSDDESVSTGFKHPYLFSSGSKNKVEKSEQDLYCFLSLIIHLLNK